MLILPLLLVALGGVPTASAAPSATLPDHWTGRWPAKLMPSGQELGTIKWRQIDDQAGRAAIGVPFGNLPFEGCPESEQTMYFRGDYNKGGKLIACTIGPDARILKGRYDGAGGEFLSGAFTVEIISDEPRIFFGKYFEDFGLVVDWCGQREPDAARPPTPAGASPATDTVRPRLTSLASSGHAGSTAVELRFRAFDDTALTRIEFTIKRAARVVAVAAWQGAPGDRPARVRWRAPKGLRGRLIFCGRAYDAAGNVSADSCAPLRLA